MPPAFPGMNPYLEHPNLWAEVHFGLISGLARSLNPVITPKYRAAVEKRVYEEALLVGVPDVSVVQQKSDAPTSRVTTRSVITPVAVNLPVAVENREHYLEIRDVGTGVVVTVVEVLSPKNKRSGEGQRRYDTKRQDILNSATHLVEIDLLRTGEPKPMAGGGSSDYRILVSRAEQRPTAELYPFNLRDPIPPFPIPLRSGDTEPIVDLKQLLDQVYEEAALELAIAYDQPPTPTVSSAVWEWIQQLG